MKVRFTRSARRQLLSAIGSIRKHDPVAAQRFRDAVEEKLRRLETFPESGRVIPEFPEFPHREVLVHPYRFFYRVEDETVWVLAVWHQAQLPERP